MERGREEREKYPIILKILDIHEKFKYFCGKDVLGLVSHSYDARRNV